MWIEAVVKANPWKRLACLGLVWLLGSLPGPLLAGQGPPPDAQALWKAITAPPGFQKWGTWSALREQRRSRCATAYGYYARVFANDIALKAKGSPLPPGSIVVREGMGMGTNTYAPNGQIHAYTVMYKVPGFNPKGGDWFWASYSGTGQVRDAGALSECIKCHQSAWQNDYLLGVELK